MADDVAVTPVTTDDGAGDDTSTVVDDTSTVLTDTKDSTVTGDTPAADNNTGDDTGNLDADDTSNTAPESYADFALPEGLEMDAAALESASPLMKEMGLTQEQGQKFVDWYAAQVQAGSDKQVEAFNQLTGEWRTASETDKEFGGDKFEESVGLARSAVEKFGTPELKQLLEDHGVGNHPEVVRFMVRVGELTKEDVPGGDSTTASSPEQSRVNQLYPKSA